MVLLVFILNLLTAKALNRKENRCSQMVPQVVNNPLTLVNSKIITKPSEGLDKKANQHSRYEVLRNMRNSWLVYNLPACPLTAEVLAVSQLLSLVCLEGNTNLKGDLQGVPGDLQDSSLCQLTRNTHPRVGCEHGATQLLTGNNHDMVGDHWETDTREKRHKNKAKKKN